MLTTAMTKNESARIRIMLENTPGAPVKEFTLSEKLTCYALSTRALALSFPNEQQNPEEFNIELRYHSEGKNQSWFIDFDDDESLEFAIQSRQGKAYVLFSASVVKKGAVAVPSPVVAAPSSVRSSSTSTPKAVKGKPKAVKKSKTTKPKGLSRAGTAGKVPADEKILASLKQLAAIGVADALRVQVAFLSGYRCLTTKSFSIAMSKLCKSGLVEYPNSKMVRLTVAGSAKAGTVKAPKSNQDIHDCIKESLQPKACELFNILSDGRARPREEVAKAMGYKCLATKSFSLSLSQMSSLGIIEYPKGSSSKIKLVQLTEIAFPFGRGSSNSSVVSNGASSSDDEEMVM